MLAKLLFCDACGSRIIGDTRRYRHVEACVEARPRFKRVYSNASDRRTKGQSYPADVYDQAIPQVLAAISVGARTKVDVITEIDRGRVVDVDAFTLARIERDRHRATDRYLRDRDTRALEATIDRLDREDQEARARPSAVVTAADARDYLEALPMLWENTDDEGMPTRVARCRRGADDRSVGR